VVILEGDRDLVLPDDGLHTGPKHVLVSYILLLIVILLCSRLYVYIGIQATALYY
jgi:hypothetical protein